MFDNLEDAFRAARQNRYKPVAEAYAAYRGALVDQGFSVDHAQQVLLEYVRYLHNRALELDAEEAFKNIADRELPEDDIESDDN